MSEAVETLENMFRAEMVTIGTSIEDAKTGQMFAYDAERLAKLADKVFTEAGYYQIEEVQLEALGDEEIMAATGAPVVLSGHRRLVQKVIAHNSKEQLYKVKGEINE